MKRQNQIFILFLNNHNYSLMGIYVPIEYLNFSHSTIRLDTASLISYPTMNFVC